MEVLIHRIGLALLLVVAILLPAGLVVRAASSPTHPDKVLERHTYRLACSTCHSEDLTCGDCHDAYGPGGEYDFSANGYDPKDVLGVICSQCHGEKSFPGFDRAHSIHVNKKFDCAWCHDFSRPERNLKLPPNYQASENMLTVASVKRKLSTKPDADSLTLSGRFALIDPGVDLTGSGITVKWGALEYGIPAGGAVRKGSANVFTVKSPKGALPVLKGTFDLVKMSFKLTIKKASIGNQGDPVDFALSFDGFEETVSVPLPAPSRAPRKAYAMRTREQPPEPRKNDSESFFRGFGVLPSPRAGSCVLIAWPTSREVTSPERCSTCGTGGSRIAPSSRGGTMSAASWLASRGSSTKASSRSSPTASP
jgi:hypothetical protein